MARKKKQKTPWEKAKGKIVDLIGGEEQIQKHKRTLVILLVVSVLISSGVWGLSRLEGYVNKLDIFTSSQVTVSLDSQPQWMSKALASQILSESFAPIVDELARIHRQGHNQEIPRILAQQLAKNAWIKKVKWVRRTFAGQMLVNCEFREPAAMLKSKGVYYLIDSNGYLLPGKYNQQAIRTCGLMEIRGAAGSIPSAGKKWNNPDLMAGLRLVKLLRTMPFRKQIQAVDVTNFKGRIDPTRSWILLITDRNTTIRWGRPPGMEDGLETTAQEKLALIAGIYKRQGHVDFGRSFIDVRRSATEVDVSIASADTVMNNE